MDREELDEVESGQSKRKAKVKELQLVEEAATITVMGLKEGRRVVWRILDGSGFLTSSFTGNSTTFFKEGRRSVGEQLYNELMDLCPDLYWLMVNENRKKGSQR